MSEILTPKQIAEEAKSAYLAGDYSEANRFFEAARQGYLSANNILMASEMANNCCVALLKAGENQAALAALKGIEDIFIKAGDRIRQAMTLGNKGTALEALNNLEEAERTYWKASEIFNEFGETELRLPLIQSISSIQLRTGRQLQAVTSMYAGVDNIEKPTLKHRFLKHLLGIPIQLMKNISKETTNGTNGNP